MSEYGGRQTDDYGRKTDDIGQTDDYGRKTNDIRQTDEYGRQTDDYGRKTDDLRQTDDYGRKTDDIRQTDDYGRKTDDYGNPINHPLAGGGDQYGGGNTELYTNQYGATGEEIASATTGAYGTHGGGGIAPGTTDVGGGGHGHGHKDDQTYSTTTEGSGYDQTYSTTTTAGGGYEPEHEKKGLMQKIKEKLPGGGGNH